MSCMARARIATTNKYLREKCLNLATIHVSKEMYRDLLIFVSNYMCHCQSMQRQYSSGNVSKMVVLKIHLRTKCLVMK